MDRKDTVARLLSLASEIVRIAGDMGHSLPPAPADRQGRTTTDGELLRASRRWHDIRRHREAVFNNSDIFTEPAWDMLLDLFSSHLQGRRLSVTDTCLAANVPTTTAWRWIAILENAGLVERAKDPTDARRSFVRLTADGIAKLTLALAGSP